MRSFTTVTILLLCAPCLFADVATPIVAPDPGPAPIKTPAINPAMLVAAIFFSTGALLFGLSAYVRGKISRKKLITASIALMLFTWGGMIVWMVFSPPNEDYLKWQAAHRKWKNKEVVEQTSDTVTAPDDMIIGPEESAQKSGQ